MAASHLTLLRHILQRSVLQLQPCQALSTSHQGVIQVTPKVSLFDQKVHIRVQGLPGNAKVTLHAVTEQEWRRRPALFVSCSHHITSQTGEVDLNTNPSVGGSYTGIDPMGLFWSMQPAPSGPTNIRMVVKDVEKPCLYTLSVYPGHLQLTDLHNTAGKTTHQPLTFATILRFIKATDVRRIPVKEGGARGMLFLPPGDGPHQGVIDMFGLAGGLMEARGALLASHGFATLSLPFFGYDDLPATFADSRFDYFEKSVKWFSAHPAVRKGGIGIIAVSGGALFALLMAWTCPEVTAIVRINGPPFHCFHDLHWKDELFLTGVRFDLSVLPPVKDGEGLAIKDGFMYKLEDFVPIWEMPTHVLSLISDDDGQIDPKLADMQRDMYPESKRHLIEVVHYPGAGHLLEPPYTPHCRSCYNPAFNRDLMWGGHIKEHAVAQDDSWRRILHFFRTNLPQ